MDEASTASLCGQAEQLNPVLRRESPKSDNAVYKGHVALPNGERRARAYVKIFPPERRLQLVFNELMGYQMALQCEVPTTYTFPCACHRSLLGSFYRFSDIGDPQFVLGVASLDVSEISVRYMGATTAAQWADIMNWPSVARVAVFDELMGNDDRHLSNLVRTGQHKYMPIDNERILFGEPWFDRDLRGMAGRHCDANVLADSIAEGTDELARQRMIDQARRFVMTTMLRVPDSADAIERLCRAPTDSTERMVDMLNQRRLLLPHLLQYHYQKGDLFRASTRR